MLFVTIGHENSTFGDCREVFCSNCWNVGEIYRNKINEHEKAIELLNEEWKKEGLKIK